MWIVQNAPNNPNLIQGYLTEILKRIGDSEGKVQEAACTAFSRLVNEAAYTLEPYIFEILQVTEILLQLKKSIFTRFLQWFSINTKARAC